MRKELANDTVRKVLINVIERKFRKKTRKEVKNQKGTIKNAPRNDRIFLSMKIPRSIVQAYCTKVSCWTQSEANDNDQRTKERQ